MYDDHYGLNGRPFQLTPDPAFWFDTATHRKAMAYLGYGLSQGEGFIVVTGEPGTGKTTLVGHLMATIDPVRLNVIHIVTTQIEADDLLRLVAAGLDVDHAGLTKAQLLAAIERGLHDVARSGRRTLLIIDEAQSLPVGSIEELRMLSNFQAGGYALLQIFLLGQPEFRQRLHGSDRLEQLRQRVIAMHHLDPMAPEEVGPYLTHRLGVVGWDGRPDFSVGALNALHRWSGGIPRRLNQLAGRVLLHGAIEGIDRFEARDVAQVVEDLAGDGLAAVDQDTPSTAPRDPVETVETVTESAPIPMTPPPPNPPRPLHLAVVPDAPWERLPLIDDQKRSPAEPAEQPAHAANHDVLVERIAVLEARVEEQEAALRRVLTLLVDWVEGEERRPDLSGLRAAG
ncbi:ExeA family protein [Sphingomonas sp. CFBP 13720]|uniref:ExeA family protein n=1 Tax=Sphingomonas sp. CFBP 13720 TaxID=2775302 RepID=UPI00177E056E|nr:AAA family ATPase [Sphingomonas sp. CFBP 13720]MBD8676967.1 AAA family ATPase [Sphingomonas sp. CFBP 13720]